ncbi:MULTISPECIES: ABC transporter ATP-binding protein [unclassified Nitratiruptor]|uniref:ABC transporter ATP-binding protein n=1 Tax=unclassified Nitratiruptor TaxID=2624044 RepID=UPI0019156032|nr:MULTISPECIES: ABC transporter ATP-binding protein [unclassified Nitratiruptor]BCD60537.1 ATP-binding cassette, subfamily C, bacterial [Nitratiruptor sp. YY08-10]BCD63974.1 ATP-binding cassette, subfamily C, bacterial [Nitratiruptor sp. YY08-14]
MYSWQTIYKQIVKHKKAFLLGQIFALLAVIASVPTPLLMPLLVDEVLLHKPGKLIAFIDVTFGSGSPLYYTLIVLALTLILRGMYVFLQVMQIRVFQTISKTISYNLRKRVLEHLEKVALKEFELLGSGKVVSRLITDIETIDTFLSSGISKFLISLLTLVGVCIVLVWIHWQLALFIIFLNPLVVVFSSKLARNVAKLKKQENLSIEIFQNALTETLELFDQIRAVNKERYFFQNLFFLAKEIKNKSIAFSYKSEAGARVSFLLFVAGFEIFRAAGIIAVAYSNLSIGLMLAVFGYLWFMMIPIQDLINIIYTKKSADIALQRINELLMLKNEPNYPHINNPFKKTPVQIELKDVWFEYYENKPVLKGIDLKIEAEKITAIVGASGSGKTTLSRLLVGFYEPDRGDIFYNDISYKRIGLDVIRENVMLVLQTPVLFNDTIWFNVTLGRDFKEEEVTKALKLAQIYDVVAKLPDGLQTVVGKGGVRLSGGERQRIAIARMILQDPAVVILDEATSAIDMETEKLLFCALKDFFSRRTTLLIAHRPSTIQEADEIFFMEHGQIVRHMDFHKYKEELERNLCILSEEQHKKDE